MSLEPSSVQKEVLQTMVDNLAILKLTLQPEIKNNKITLLDESEQFNTFHYF